jgi:hypothetical protein
MEQLEKPRHLCEDGIERTGSERIKSLDACFPLREDNAFFKQFCIVGFTPDRILALHGRSSHRITSSTAKCSGNIQA